MDTPALDGLNAFIGDLDRIWTAAEFPKITLPNFEFPKIDLPVPPKMVTRDVLLGFQNQFTKAFEPLYTVEMAFKDPFRDLTMAINELTAPFRKIQQTMEWPSAFLKEIGEWQIPAGLNPTPLPALMREEPGPGRGSGVHPPGPARAAEGPHRVQERLTRATGPGAGRGPGGTSRGRRTPRRTGAAGSSAAG